VAREAVPTPAASRLQHQRMTAPPQELRMDDLTRKSLFGLAKFQALLAIMIFLPAGTIAYWQGWAVWALTFCGNVSVTLYMLRYDRALFERRMKAGPSAEREPSQKLIIVLIMFGSCAMVILSGLDHRFAWSSVPLGLMIGGDALVALGYAIIFRVLRENTYASSTIEVASGQEIVETGPYALVRHPMYAGAILAFIGTPLALASWWGELATAFASGVIVWRLLDEERLLHRELQGYADYVERIKWRLLRGAW
jgi:protein-S-isoprenylcysteine O-methyltransferase Ste14